MVWHYNGHVCEKRGGTVAAAAMECIWLCCWCVIETQIRLTCDSPIKMNGFHFDQIQIKLDCLLFIPIMIPTTRLLHGEADQTEVIKKIAY